MNLSKYYKNGIITPAFIVITCYLLYEIVYLVLDLGKGYKSDFLTKNNFSGITVLIVVANAVFLGILSTPLFLNTFRQVRNSFFLNLLTWFLLPGTWICYLIIKHISYLLSLDNGFDQESIFIFSNTLPYLFGLVLSYREFNLNKRIIDSGFAK